MPAPRIPEHSGSGAIRLGQQLNTHPRAWSSSRGDRRAGGSAPHPRCRRAVAVRPPMARLHGDRHHQMQRIEVRRCNAISCSSCITRSRGMVEALADPEPIGRLPGPGGPRGSGAPRRHRRGLGFDAAFSRAPLSRCSDAPLPASRLAAVQGQPLGALPRPPQAGEGQPHRAGAG